MTIDQRKKSLKKPDVNEDEFEIPIYKRKGVKLKF